MTQTAKLIMKNFSGVKDYAQLEKLAKTYEKIKTANSLKPNLHKAKELAKLKEKILPLIQEVEDGLNRIIKVYGNAVEEIKEAKENNIYQQKDIDSFYAELLQMHKNTLNYKKLVEV